MARPRFKIPDYPADRPKVPEVLALVREYYSKPGNGAGGLLHVELDDGNLQPLFLQSALKECCEQGDTAGARIMELMLKMTTSQRRRVYRSKYV